MSRIHQRTPLNLDPRTHAFPYQDDAVRAIRSLPYAAVFHEQGLGKTKIAIDLALEWLRSGDVDCVLVVTKKSLVKNWLNEFSIHSHLKPRALSSDRAANHRALFSTTRVFVSGYESVKVEEEKVRVFCGIRRVGAILDESQKLKNPNSALTEAFLRLASCFKKRVIMTGTPMANRPFDIWSQICFLDGGTALGEDFERFRQELDLPNTGRLDDYIERLEGIFPAIAQFAIRETKDSSGLSLPGKVFQTLQASWEEQQQVMYDQIRTQLRVEILRDGRRVIDSADAILKRLLRLVQVASNPRTIDESYDKVPGKVGALETILAHVRGQDEKAIIWTSFVENCRYLRRHLSADNAVEVHGHLPISSRNNNIERFKREDSVRFLVATPAAAKEGFTLTEANHAVFFDRSFSLDDYRQAQDRIHRISQDKTCYIHRIVMPESIDEWIDVLIEIKSAAADVGMGDTGAEELRSLAEFDLDDVLGSVLSRT